LTLELVLTPPQALGNVAQADDSDAPRSATGADAARRTTAAARSTSLRGLVVDEGTGIHPRWVREDDIETTGRA
jgi:hypothetical protein